MARQLLTSFLPQGRSRSVFTMNKLGKFLLLFLLVLPEISSGVTNLSAVAEMEPSCYGPCSASPVAFLAGVANSAADPLTLVIVGAGLVALSIFARSRLRQD
jgi:hypothetical protein